MDSFSNNVAEDSDSDADYWESKFVRLDPERAWTKPPQNVVYLTNVTTYCKPEDPDDLRGVLIAENWTGSICLCCLFKSSPSQIMRLIWRSDQEVTFVNHGNYPITLSLLIKSISV